MKVPMNSKQKKVVRGYLIASIGVLGILIAYTLITKLT